MASSKECRKVPEELNRINSVFAAGQGEALVCRRYRDNALYEKVKAFNIAHEASRPKPVEGEGACLDSITEPERDAR